MEEKEVVAAPVAEEAPAAAPAEAPKEGQSGCCRWRRSILC